MFICSISIVFLYFNPRSHEGSDVLRRLPSAVLRYFNPRSREGSDILCFLIWPDSLAFQSTLPRRERRDSIDTAVSSAAISIHAPAKGATTINQWSMPTNIFQSTLPRRERLWLSWGLIRVVKFQSTLPRRERLSARPVMQQLLRISIHAPAKGATFTGYSYFFQFNDFNPRSREGSDADHTGIPQGPYISIHAPAKGATNKDFV